MGGEEQKACVHPLVSAVDKLKNLLSSSEKVMKTFLSLHSPSPHTNPIEILKRLQREAFSDLMKLRERQDKTERMLAFFSSTKGNPFQESSTHIKGEVDLGGALLFLGERNFSQVHNILDAIGMRTGAHTRFTFQTPVRQKDTLVTEFVASQTNGVVGGTLSLGKVLYLANITDWFSLIAIPVGAIGKDLGTVLNPSQDHGLTDFSALGPPVFSQPLGCAAGITLQGLKGSASMAELVSGFGAQSGPENDREANVYGFSTFAQLLIHLAQGTRLSLYGLHRNTRPLTKGWKQGTHVISNLPSEYPSGCDTSRGMSSLDATHNNPSNSLKSVGLMLESEVDDSMRIGGWFEYQKTELRSLNWAVSIIDDSDNGLGWGFSVGGSTMSSATLLGTVPQTECENKSMQLQLEAFLKLNLGKRCSLQPGFLCVVDGQTRIPALMLRSRWHF
ncbi:uncharacterized protein LOC18447982 isoform X1 [Amborella trichopoda]|uniref:uncharacterized protein LOC18447982 isoform X1 n=1 Tax=Amborella trichopoda TaxID=13333 RepID=UPI0005D45688|nr:uncharacterized protein LOC18447982 isoform X1 [Amborella trichopoda]|eukprot:XP_011628447.1 uncharacterized protein LOC18447982 isoform X1 [Amborella trichopoda]